LEDCSGGGGSEGDGGDPRNDRLSVDQYLHLVTEAHSYVFCPRLQEFLELGELYDSSGVKNSFRTFGGEVTFEAFDSRPITQMLSIFRKYSCSWCSGDYLPNGVELIVARTDGRPILGVR
jgi:hypothetical protein